MSEPDKKKFNPWPDEKQVVFLIDCNTGTEQKLLEAMIACHKPADASHKTVRVNLRHEAPSEREMSRLIDDLGDPESFVVPLRVTWFPTGPRAHRKILVRDLLTGNTDNPGRLRQLLIHRRNPEPWTAIVADGDHVGSLESRFTNSSPSDDGRPRFVKFVLKAAFLALERAERQVKGSRYKIPKMFPGEVVGEQSRVQPVLEELSMETGTPIGQLREQARDCLEEMRADHTALAIDRIASFGRYLYTRGFDPEIDLIDEDLERVKRLVGEKAVAFVFTHKSHIDGFMLLTLFYDNDLPPVHIFGGINMKMRGLGTFFKKAGCIFLRRTFQDDPVYKAVFKSYIDYLGRNRFPLMWALEGTRSRIGKLMPPRYGLLNYVMSAYSHGDAADILFVPISAIYDQVPEVGDYDAIQGGATKRPESTSWFMEYISGLKAPHGRIYVRFGEGVALSDLVDINELTNGIDDRLVQKMAFRLSVDANNVTPVTPIAVITYVLLTHGHRALTRSELVGELWPVLKLVHKMKLPRTSDLAAPEGEVLERALELLENRGVISAFRDGEEPVYGIAANAGRTAAYYRNGMIHFLVNGAIADVSLLFVRDDDSRDASEQFRDAALRIRDILKFEFFFEETDEFLESLDDQLELRAPGWREDVAAGAGKTSELLRRLDSIIGHGVLRPFIEAYLMVAEILARSEVDMTGGKASLVQGALRLGKQRLHQQRMHCEESLSTNYFDNAVKIADSRGLLEYNEKTAAGRTAFRDELVDLVNAVKQLASTADSKSLEQRRG